MCNTPPVLTSFAKSMRRNRSVRDAYSRLLRLLPGTLRTALQGSGARTIRPAQLAGWLDHAHQSDQSDLRGRRLIVFAYLPWWIDFMTAVSASLIGRGADVTFAWLPYWAFDQETPENDREMAARYEAVLGRPRERFRSVNLKSLTVTPATVTDEMTRTAYFDTQYVLRREEIDIENEHQGVFQLRLGRLRQAYAAFEKLLADGRFDSALIPNGGVLEFAAVWQAARDFGIDSVTLESWEKLGTCAVGYGRPCFEEIAKELWNADSGRLDEPRRARVERSMRERESPDWTGHVVSYQNAAVQDAQGLRTQLGLDDRRPIALVCPNVPYDAAFLRFESGFKTMADWLRTLVRQLEARVDWQVVIRAHPGETALASRQGAESILTSAIENLPAHFHFIGPAEKVNTYALMRIATAGFVFGSTTGLEMAARGLPVVMPAATHYARKGFTRDAFTREGYIAAVLAQLDGPGARLTQAEIDLAWCYMDVYMNQWCRPFPWCLPTFPNDIRSWPIERVLGGEGMRLFGETFTILTGGEGARRRMSIPAPQEAS